VDYLASLRPQLLLLLLVLYIIKTKDFFFFLVAHTVVLLVLTTFHVAFTAAATRIGIRKAGPLITWPGVTLR
jgi:hypothetical protein